MVNNIADIIKMFDITYGDPSGISIIGYGTIFDLVCPYSVIKYTTQPQSNCLVHHTAIFIHKPYRYFNDLRYALCIPTTRNEYWKNLLGMLRHSDWLNDLSGEVHIFLTGKCDKNFFTSDNHILTDPVDGGSITDVKIELPINYVYNFNSDIDTTIEDKLKSIPDNGNFNVSVGIDLIVNKDGKSIGASRIHQKLHLIVDEEQKMVIMNDQYGFYFFSYVLLMLNLV